MPKNIALFFDGTSNQFGDNNTNVIRLLQAIDRDRQHVYYDPGVGTLPEPQWTTAIVKRLSEAAGLALGVGLLNKVEAAYRYLMDHWEQGSQVYVFGFSRGAYTARVLAGLLHSLGLLSRGNHCLTPYVLRLFKSLRKQTEGDDGRYWRLSNGFRNTFARAVGRPDRRFPIHFLGLWDTVSSVGWFWEPTTFPYTAKNPSVAVARHAVSLDERRAFFKQNLLRAATEQDWEERWFPGVHADIGGGYAEAEGGLWRPAFEWILSEAMRYELQVDETRLTKVRNHHLNAPAEPWGEPLHESLRRWWWLAEGIPKPRLRADGRTTRMPNFGRRRSIPRGALLDESALRRIRRGDYRPHGLSAAFIDSVCALSDAPPTLTYPG